MRALTAVVATVLVAGVAAGCSSDDGQQHAPPSAPSTPSAPSSAAASTPVPTATTTLSGYQRVQQWYAAVQPHFAAIQQDTEAIKAAAGQNNVAALPRLCQSLQNHVVQVAGDRAPPDKRIGAAVLGAVNAYGSAAKSCLAGDYGAAADGINKGAHYLEQANAIINDLGN